VRLIDVIKRTWFMYPAIIAAVFAAVMLPVLYLMSPAVGVSVAAHADGFNITLAVTKGEIHGVFLVYGPVHAKQERYTAVGICNGTRSDEIRLVEGETVVCAFLVKLVRGLEYGYVLYVMYDGRRYAALRGATVPK